MAEATKKKAVGKGRREKQKQQAKTLGRHGRANVDAGHWFPWSQNSNKPLLKTANGRTTSATTPEEHGRTERRPSLLKRPENREERRGEEE